MSASVIIAYILKHWKEILIVFTIWLIVMLIIGLKAAIDKNNTLREEKTVLEEKIKEKELAIEEVKLNLDTCSIALNSKDNIKEELIQAIEEKCVAENIINDHTAELDRCLKQKSEYLVQIDQLKEKNKCPVCDCSKESSSTIWQESLKIFDLKK